MSSNRRELKEGNRSACLTVARFSLIRHCAKIMSVLFLRAFSYDFYIPAAEAVKNKSYNGEDAVVSCVICSARLEGSEQTNGDVFRLVFVCIAVSIYTCSIFLGLCPLTHAYLCLLMCFPLAPVREAYCTRVKRIRNLYGYPISRGRMHNKGLADTLY